MKSYTIATMKTCVCVEAETVEDAVREAAKQDANFIPWVGMPVTDRVSCPANFPATWWEERSHWVSWFKGKCISISSDKQ